MGKPREAKSPEKMTKAALLSSLGKKLSKGELVAFHKAVANGYRPFAEEPDYPEEKLGGVCAPPKEKLGHGGARGVQSATSSTGPGMIVRL